MIEIKNLELSLIHKLIHFQEIEFDHHEKLFLAI
mgnify:CR=1 FL=1